MIRESMIECLTKLCHRCPHQALTCVLQFAELPDLPDVHVRVAKKGCLESIFENRPRRLSRAAWMRARMASLDSPTWSAPTFRNRHARLRWDINAVKHWTKNTFLIFGHHGRRAGGLAPSGSRPERDAGFKGVSSEMGQ